MAIEQRPVEYLIPVGFCLSVQQQVDAVIALAIERRKEEDKRTQDSTTYKEFDISSQTVMVRTK